MRTDNRYKTDIIDLIGMICGMLVIFMLVFSLVLFTKDAFAADATSIHDVKGLPGSASLSAPKISIRTIFSGDDDGDLSITYTWKEDDGDDNFSTPLGNYTTGTGLSSPYSYEITGLDNSKVYRVKVDYTDADGGSGSIILTDLKPYNPMLHNAVSTGSTKWAAQNGWGVTGGQYGEFGCPTCHERKSGNIKRVRKVWTDASIPNVPIKADGAGETVVFNDDRDGSAQFAEDDTVDHTGADRICEACHSATSYHQHDMTAIGADHNSSKNCRSCHPHNQGFRPASCSSCHGGGTVGSVSANIWPDSADETTDQALSENDSGEHALHISLLSQKLYGASLAQLLDRSTSLADQKAICLYCHAVNDDDHTDTGDDNAEVFSADVGGSATTVAKSMWGGTDNTAAYTIVGGTCATVDCHNNTTVAVAWYGGVDTSCTMCHNTGGDTNPTSGLHDVTPSVTGQRHDSSISGGCVACHTDLTSQSTHIDGTGQAGNNQETQMGLAAFYNQTADNTGTCSNTNCHYEVNGGADGSSDDWDHEWNSTAGFYTNATTACAGCHGDWANDWNSSVTHVTTAGTSAKHGTGTTYKCKDCHNLEASSGYTFTFSSADWNPASGETSTHGDGQIQVNNVTGYNPGTGYCVNCHTSGAYNFSDTSWAIVSVAGDAITTSCGECHKGGAAPGSISASHTDHGIIDSDISAGGAKCVICHGNNGGSNFQNTLANNHGNGNIELLNTRISSYGGTLVKWDNDEGTCSNSCHATDANPVWDTTATLACDQCHYFDATPTTAENNADDATIGGAHNSHFDAGAVTACTQCHPDNSGETAPYDHIDGTTLLERSREAIDVDNADMTAIGADFNDSANTCSNAACHDPSDDGHVSAAWTATNSSCQMCHSNSDPGTESHTEHLNASTNFGVTINCNSCHPTASGRDHMDLNIDVQVSVNSVTTTVVNSALLNGCGTNDCHNDGTSLTTGTPTDYTWGTALTNCTECHGTTATQSSNAHNEHLAYTGAACTDCHTVATATTHINQSVNIDASKATFSLGASVAVGTTPDGTCATDSCHNQSGGDSVAWNVPNGDVAGTSALTCDSCHYFDATATSAENTSHFASLSSSHGDHFDGGKVCTQCHGALPTTTSHIDSKTSLTDGAVAQQDEAGMDWTDGSATTDYSLAADNSCGSATNNGLGCHATGTPDWDVAFAGSDCTNCHTNTTNSAVNPTSGLHGTTNLLDHDDAFNTDKTCTSCHDSSTPSSGHTNGTLQNGGAVTYTWNTTYMAAGYVRATDDCAATCHLDNGTWNREWSGVTDSAWQYSDDPASAAVCGNCHGSFSQGWNIVGETSHLDPDADNAPDDLFDADGSHNQCSLCHGWGHSNYTSNTKHVNNTNPKLDDLDMNSTVGYNNADGSCSINCHSALTLTMNTNSGWTIVNVAGDGVTCGGCHTDGVQTGAESATHLAHGADRADLVSAQGSWTACTPCHPDVNYDNAHSGTREFDTDKITYSGGENGTCLTADCHNRDSGSLQSTAWDIATQLDCDDCHYYAASPTAANNTAHASSLSASHGDHFEAGKTCTQCHGAMPAAGNTSHSDGGDDGAPADLADKATASQNEASLNWAHADADTDYTFNDSANSCSSATNNGLGCHATGTPDWDNAFASTACTDCHSDTSTAAVNPTSGLHSVTPSVSGQQHDDGVTGGCAACHTSVPDYGTHKDGTFTANGTIAANRTNMGLAGFYTTGGSDNNGTCASTGCHFAAGGSSDDWPHAWNSAANFYTTKATSCAGCHGDWTNGWNSNVTHQTSGGTRNTHGDTISDTVIECGECHVIDAGTGNYTFTFSTADWNPATGETSHHGNGTIEVNSKGSYFKDTTRLCDACHKSVDGTHDFSDTGWAVNATLVGDDISASCAGCHGGHFNHSNNTYDGTNYWPDSASQTSNSGTSENDSGEHVKHMTSLADKVLGLTLEELLADGSSHDKQVQLCNLCHANPGSDGDHTTGFVAEVRFLQPDGDADGGTAATYSAAADTCNSVDCHNGKNVQAANNWYAGSSGSCLLCHTEDNSNGEAISDPTSGLHIYNASYTDVTGHDSSFDSGSGNCNSCHTTDPSSGHFNSVANAPDTATFNFQSSAAIDVKLNTLADTTDDTCAADCHTDQGYWYRKWSQDAYFSFDPATFDTTNALPDGCDVCHGIFGSWAAGSSHAGTYDGIASTKGSSHNGPDEPGTRCEDCHVFPSEDYHNNGGNKITLNDSNGDATFEGGNGINPVFNATDDVWSCEPCHDDSVLPPISNSYAFPDSQAFSVERISGLYVPSGSCFSGEWTSACHGYIDEGSSIERWWPEADPRLHDDLSKHPGDPANVTHDSINFGYPNRAGAHHEHNITIGELVCGKRISGTCTADPTDGFTDPTDEDYNATCIFCHPMTVDGGVLKATNHYDGVVDVYGGYTYDDLSGAGLDKGRGIANSDPASGSWTKYDAIAGDGYIYQLDDPNNPGTVYPLDTDGEYRQYIYNYRTENDVNHGTCSNIACHSNAPFTPNWYGDDQAPAPVDTLKAYTAATSFNASDYSHSHYAPVTLDDACQDVTPGAVLLTWLAPGDNGDFDGTAYEYEVYYSTSGVITDANVGSATRVGGAPTVHRQDELQCMIVDGLTPGSNYYFAVRTKDQPKYVDTNDDGVFEKFIEDGNVALVAATTSTVAAHDDDVAPVFWGTNLAESHDTGGTINLSWEAARDHTLPLTYLVYWSDYALKTHLATGGTMPTFTTDGGVYSQGYNEGAPPTTCSSNCDYYIEGSSTSGLSYQVTGLGTGILYNFLARAKDGASPANIDTNTVVAMAMATSMPEETETLVTRFMSGTTAVGSGDTTASLATAWGTADTDTLATGQSITFTDTSPLSSRDTWVQGISVDMTVTNNDRKQPESFQVDFGYATDTSCNGFTSLGSPYTLGLGRRASRVMKISLSSFEDRVPAGRYLCLEVTSLASSSDGGTANSITVGWGNATYKGQLLATSQPINHQPTAPSLTLTEDAGGNGYITVDWSGAADNDGDTQTLHYDVFGSTDGGSNWPYLIGTGLSGPTVVWDTVGDGLKTNNLDCTVKVEVSDGYLYETTPGSGTWYSHNAATDTITVHNGSDTEAPAEVVITHVEPRPKQGSAYLHWLAVGNDGYNHGTRAGYYDIRSRKVADGALTALNWNDADTVQAYGEPVPGFAGTAETFELLDMVPDTDYQVAIRTCDNDNNCSGLSNVYTITSGQYYCGICHSTPPDEPETGGVHREHGYTLEDCAKCHGDGTSESGSGNNVNTYDGRHYDGVINIGWGRDSIGGPQSTLETIAPTDTSNVTITQGVYTIYEDPDGSGGYNAPAPYNPSTPLVNTDSGSCMNFVGVNATGCHGPFEPKWASDTIAVRKEPHCADCHGASGLTDPSVRDLDPYGREWDDSSGGVPSDDVLASPPLPNRVYIDPSDDRDTMATDRYVGAHERHLNASFRFAKEDSCRLCHRDTMEQGLHADGNIDIVFDDAANQDESTEATFDQNHPTVDTDGMSCGSLNNAYCHDSGANWAEFGAKCNDCHGMGGKAYTVGAATSEIGHVSSSIGTVADCLYCHVAGHPQSPDGIQSGDPEALLINNNGAVGINYRSGGIHIRSDYPWGTYTTLAETCWGCHEREGISEWESNKNVQTGDSDYDFGSLYEADGTTPRRAWTGAVWKSGYSTEFAYKTGYIQSTHTTDPSGTSAVTWNATYGRYEETPDDIAKIRCSNCHDVHDSNLAPGDTMTGRPYLRGTWMTNPYEEDGAPWNKNYSFDSTVYSFNAVPRGGTGYTDLGGFYIDQNNVKPGTARIATTDPAPTLANYPTSGWTIKSSAGLCVLCHGDDVDKMDQRLPATDPVEGNLWLGTNGHSNSVLGGTFTYGVNIFDYTHGRPSPVTYNWGNPRPKTTGHLPVQVPDMAFISQGEAVSAGGGYRGNDSNTGQYNPRMNNQPGQTYPYGYNTYDWGATVDSGTTDQMYHQFSCSKCHNPHASRLPKLMITNCLDIRHNVWDDNKSSLQTKWTAAALTAVDRNMPAAYYASAQNCHRFDGRRANTTLRGGWNKVTPWTHSNLDNSQHGNNQASENYTGGRTGN